MESFIGAMLERLLMVSAQAALLAAAVWLLCRYLPRLSPATQCWLWWLVALQVLVGLSMAPIGLPLLPRAPAAVPALLNSDALPAVAAMPMPSVQGGPSFWQAAVLLLWLGGIAVMGVNTLRQWRWTRELVRKSSPCSDGHVLQMAARVVEAQGKGAAPRLRLSQQLESPMVIGHFRPVLLLPADASLSIRELEMAVAHELEHLRRADLWWGLVPMLARHCFFFHPLVHLAVRDYGIAREAACDVAVVDAGDRSRHEYGELLVRLGTAAGSSSGLAAASSTFRSLSRRLMLLQRTSFMPRAGAVAVVILGVVGVMPLRLVAAVADVAVVPAILTSGTVTTPIAETASEKRVAEVTRNPPAAKPRARAVRVANAPAAVDIATLEQQRIEYLAHVAQADAAHQAQQTEREARLFEEMSLAEANLRQARAGMEAAQAEAMRSGALDQGPAQERLARYEVQLQELQAHATAATEKVEAFRARTSAQALQPKLSQLSPPVVYTGEPMTVNFQDIPTTTLLQLLSSTSGRTIVVDQSVTGSVTIKLNNMPWDQILDIVLSSKKLEKRVQGNEIVVATAAAFAAMDQAAGATTR